MESGVIACQAGFARIAEIEPALRLRLMFRVVSATGRKRVIYANARTVADGLLPSKKMKE